MADSDRVVFPEEVEDAKAAAATENKPESGDTNTVEESPAQPAVTMRNMIQVPDNCPPGYQMGSDGILHMTSVTSRTVVPSAVEDAHLAAIIESQTNEVKLGGDPPNITKRNMIVVPDNCTQGKQMGKDGVCREVFEN